MKTYNQTKADYFNKCHNEGMGRNQTNNSWQRSDERAMVKDALYTQELPHTPDPTTEDVYTGEDTF